MVNPVHGYEITVPYRKRGPMWSCERDANGEGVHTGVDIGAPKGTPVSAARPGVVRHVSYGVAFGPYQFAIVAADGSADFYAHTLGRPKDGSRVAAGETIALVGDLGHTTGPHLHFERLPVFSTRWTCGNHANPLKSINWEGPMGIEYHYGGKPTAPQVIGTKYATLEQSKWDPTRKGLELAMIYVNASKMKLKPGAVAGALRLRAIRLDTSDKTGYHDYILIPDASDGGTQLITHVYFEAGDSGPTKWQAKCIGGLQEVTLTTRYRKGAVVFG